MKAKLAEQIEARGQVADGPTIFCEACAMLDAATGGPGIVADEGAPFYEAPNEDLARALAARPMTNEVLAAELRNIATRLGDLAIEVD